MLAVATTSKGYSREEPDPALLTENNQHKCCFNHSTPFYLFSLFHLFSCCQFLQSRIAAMNVESSLKSSPSPLITPIQFGAMWKAQESCFCSHPMLASLPYHSGVQLSSQPQNRAQNFPPAVQQRHGNMLRADPRSYVFCRPRRAEQEWVQTNFILNQVQ